MLQEDETAQEEACWYKQCTSVWKLINCHGYNIKNNTYKQTEKITWQSPGNPVCKYERYSGCMAYSRRFMTFLTGRGADIFKAYWSRISNSFRMLIVSIVCIICQKRSRNRIIFYSRKKIVMLNFRLLCPRFFRRNRIYGTGWKDMYCFFENNLPKQLEHDTYEIVDKCVERLLVNENVAEREKIYRETEELLDNEEWKRFFLW